MQCGFFEIFLKNVAELQFSKFEKKLCLEPFNVVPGYNNLKKVAYFRKIVVISAKMEILKINFVNHGEKIVLAISENLNSCKSKTCVFKGIFFEIQNLKKIKYCEKIKGTL